MKLSDNHDLLELNDDEIERYKRHISLKHIGIEGQTKLKNSSVIFVGAGGLGSSAILYAAAAGIGKIGVVDNDHIEKSNLQRQVIHNIKDLGKSKTESAKQKIMQLNPNCFVETFTNRLNIKNVLTIFKEYDIVCDCSDNFGTRYLVNDACLILEKPLIYGAVQGFEGQISVFNLKIHSPNLRDFIPTPPAKNAVPSCNEFGVLGITPGIIGVLQANEIIKIIINKGEILDGKILIFNLLQMSMKKLNLKSDDNFKKIDDLNKFSNDYKDESCIYKKYSIQKINRTEFQKIYKNDFQKIFIIDVREKNEFNKCSIKGSISIPLNSLENKSNLELIKKNSDGKIIYTLCQKGIRSIKASQILLGHKIQSISIEGGLENIGGVDTIILK